MSLRVCAVPGCPTLVKSGRCELHAGPVKRSPTYQHRNTTPGERQRRADTVAAWVRLYGWVCPGYRTPEHPSEDLTAAHMVAVTSGGGDGPLAVLCRACNSRQGTTPGEGPPMTPRASQRQQVPRSADT